MNVVLSEDRERFVRSLVEAGHYDSEGEVIDEALRLLERQAREKAGDRERIEALLIEGADSGPSTPMTSDDWDEILGSTVTPASPPPFAR